MMAQVVHDEKHRKPTTIWVVRHAEREDNVNKAWRRWFYAITHLAKDDSPLSKRGRLQAEECAARFANVHLDHVFSSPYNRCIETAVRIVRSRGMSIKVEPGLSEVTVSGFLLCGEEEEEEGG
ncbi:unnamed protein product [Toxocara canis]|uniref:Phosphoglycerate mutase family protein n=1 Tax=Toxocara canis TaxID=6265 RepID=A0A183U701_TOXCA|nr:unnamed protein product [Toxocara canis]